MLIARLAYVLEEQVNSSLTQVLTRLNWTMLTLNYILQFHTP